MLSRAAPAGLLGVLVVAVAVLADSESDALDNELARLLALPSAKERKSAAVKLAARKETSLAQWREAALRFRRTIGIPAATLEEVGASTPVVTLRVEGKDERTEITVYLPAGYRRDEKAPLLLALHGAGGSGHPEYRRWQPIADELGMIVVAPTEAGDQVGYAFTRRERTSALEALRWARSRYWIDTTRIHLTGISRGGHLTWDLALRHPDRFASMSPMIGGPRLDTRAGQNNLRFLQNVAGIPIRDLQGEGDDPRLLFNLRYAFERLKEFGAADAQLITFPGMAHSFEMEAVSWIEFLGQARREPNPARVVRLCADPREGRAWWAEATKLDRSIREGFTPKVDPRTWNRLDDAGKRRHVAAAAEDRTGRLEVVMKAPGHFAAHAHGVTSFRLLLDPSMYDPAQPVVVEWKGREWKRRVKPSKRVLLQEFAERFDPEFLPEAEVVIR